VTDTESPPRARAANPSASPAAIAPIPKGLTAIGARSAPYGDALALTDLPEGSMRRVTFGELDVLLAHSTNGIAAVDDRCPHMSAPLSIGTLEGCIVGCPLHDGRFDLATGNVERMPTTGGLLPDGTYVPVWTPEGKDPKPDPPGIKAEARRLTRVRRFRYYPVRIVGDRIEVAIPTEAISEP
jgi:nitrite reductase/ring-hydroxylating ferredoxin subunit